MLFRKALLAFTFSLAAFIAKSQDLVLSGKLMENITQAPISGATVTLTAQKDSLNPKTVLTNADGLFSFTGLYPDRYRIITSNVGYEVIVQQVNLQASNKVPLQFNLARLSKDLETVVIQSTAPPVTQKGDTLQFNASQFKVNPDATAEDMIKKLPGVVIDKNGNVTAAGEAVKKVTVDGRDFFGDDATATLKNLPASVIDKIQVFDKLSDQAALTGFDDGNSVKSINIVTKANMRNGQFGRLYAGVGTDNRYSVGGNTSFFKNNFRLTLVGISNNVNQQNFASQDLLGISGSNSGGGGRGGRGGRGGGGGSEGFTVGQQNGISKTNSFGVNYADLWGKKAEVSGSYFFNNRNNNNDKFSNSEYFQKSGVSQFYKENQLSGSQNFNHRVNLRLNYKFDDKNTLMITPSLSYQNNTTNSLLGGFSYYKPADTISTAYNNSNYKTNGYNFNNNILFRHGFAKTGRSVSLNVNTSTNRTNGDNYIQNTNRYYDSIAIRTDSLQQYTDVLNNGYQLSANVAYTEPVGKKAQLQLNYQSSYAKSSSDQETYQYDYSGGKYSLFDNNLSNKFDNLTTKQSAGLSYRVGDRDNMFNAGLTYQYTDLSSNRIYPITGSVNKTFNNVLPQIMWRKKINARNSIRLFARGNTNTPSVTQLQDVYNNNNPLFISTGNPDLKQQAGYFLGSRFTYTNTAKAKSFFANLFLQQYNNYITNATYTAANDSILNNSVTLYRGSRLSKPVNLDGFFNVRSFFTYAMPVKAIKSNLSLNTGLSYSKTPGLLNGVLNKSNAYTYNAGAALASNISQYIDFNLNYSANLSNVKNSINDALNNRYVLQTAGIQLNLLHKKGWFAQNDVNNETYSGLTSGFNQNYWLWNAAIGKKFLKNQAGELKLSVFDLLKQNQSIVRTVTETYIEDVQNQVLKQYFMLTFSYSLKNFGTAKARAENTGSTEHGPGGNRNF
ncbi:MAG: outer membrane beta-barrel protein [Ferruginibacter sp.]